MVRYLSSAWFERLRETTGSSGAPEGTGGTGAVLRYHVDRATERISYDVVAGSGPAFVRHPTEGDADLTFVTDYATAAAVASGSLSTQAALTEGRIRVAGDLGLLVGLEHEVGGADPVPAAVRAETEY
jgi:hypothetical protein